MAKRETKKVVDDVDPRIVKLHEEVLYPVVRVRAGNSGGSGTVLYSKKDVKGNVRTFVLTNHHVVEDLINIGKVWNSRLGREIKKDIRQTAEAQFFKYNNWSKCVGSFSVEADIVAYEPEEDMALLELRDRERLADHIACMIPETRVGKICIYDDIYACGATLLHAPFSTPGAIVFQDDEIENKKYWLGTSLISFGNSGGAVFRYCEESDKYEFIGVPSRVQLQGFNDVANWMGYFIPPNRVMGFLKEQKFQFIFDSSITLEQCEELRKNDAVEEVKRLEKKEGVVIDE